MSAQRVVHAPAHWPGLKLTLCGMRFGVTITNNPNDVTCRRCKETALFRWADASVQREEGTR